MNNLDDFDNVTRYSLGTCASVCLIPACTCCHHLPHPLSLFRGQCLGARVKSLKFPALCPRYCLQHHTSLSSCCSLLTRSHTATQCRSSLFPTQTWICYDATYYPSCLLGCQCPAVSGPTLNAMAGACCNVDRVDSLTETIRDVLPSWQRHRTGCNRSPLRTLPYRQMRSSLHARNALGCCYQTVVVLKATEKNRLLMRIRLIMRKVDLPKLKHFSTLFWLITAIPQKQSSHQLLPY